MKSRAVQITRYFFYLLAALWLVVGINYLGQSDGQMIFYIIAGMMFASIFVFIALGMNITKKTSLLAGRGLPRRLHPADHLRSVRSRRLRRGHPLPHSTRHHARQTKRIPASPGDPMKINYQETSKDLLTRIDIHEKYGSANIDHWTNELLQPQAGHENSRHRLRRGQTVLPVR